MASITCQATMPSCRLPACISHAALLRVHPPKTTVEAQPSRQTCWLRSVRHQCCVAQSQRHAPGSQCSEYKHVLRLLQTVSLLSRGRGRQIVRPSMFRCAAALPPARFSQSVAESRRLASSAVEAASSKEDGCFPVGKESNIRIFHHKDQ